MSYTPLLISIIILLALALGFLISGIAVFYRQRGLSQPGQAVRTQQTRNASRRGSNMAAIIVLAIPLIVLLAGASFGQLSTRLSQNTLTPSATVTLSPTTTPLPLVTPGTLTIGVSDNNYTSPPEIYYVNQSPAGFDIDLINAIAQAMKLKPSPIPTQVGSTDQLLEGLKNKKFDVVISAYLLTGDIKAATQSVPYLTPKDVLLAPNGYSGNLKNFKTLTDLCGHTIGVQNQTAELDTLNKTNCQPGQQINIVGSDSPKFSNVNDVANALINKQYNIEAIYQSTPTVSYYQHQFPGKFQQVGKPVPLPDEGILIRQDNQLMQDAIMNAFNSLVQNGKYNNLLKTQNWDLTGDSIALNPAVTPTVVPSK